MGGPAPRRASNFGTSETHACRGGECSGWRIGYGQGIPLGTWCLCASLRPGQDYDSHPHAFRAPNAAAHCNRAEIFGEWRVPLPSSWPVRTWHHSFSGLYTLLGITPHAKIAAMEHFFFKHICKAPGGSSDVFINRSDRMVPLSIRGNRHPRKSVADHRNAAWSGTQHA